MSSNVAHIRYFWRMPRRGVLTHVVVPALGVVALAYPLYSVAAPGQPYPYNLVPSLSAFGSSPAPRCYHYYRAKSPEKIAAIGAFITADDPGPSAAPGPWPRATRHPGCATVTLAVGLAR